MRTMLRKTEMHDIGKLLFAFVMLYAYLSFSQWLIIWSANMPDEANWYLHRLAGNWINLGRFLILFEFAVPFALLLSRRLKKQPAFMVPLALPKRAATAPARPTAHSLSPGSRRR